MPGSDFIRMLLQQASAQGSRSTAMNPLGWALAIVLSSLGFLVWAHAPMWLVVWIGVFASILLITYIGSYLFFMLTDTDALRSERFALSKLQLEKSQVGDTLHGFSAAAPVGASTPVLLSSADGND